MNLSGWQWDQLKPPPVSPRVAGAFQDLFGLGAVGHGVFAQASDATRLTPTDWNSRIILISVGIAVIGSRVLDFFKGYREIWSKSDAGKLAVALEQLSGIEKALDESKRNAALVLEEARKTAADTLAEAKKSTEIATARIAFLVEHTQGLEQLARDQQQTLRSQQETLSYQAEMIRSTNEARRKAEEAKSRAETAATIALISPGSVAPAPLTPDQTTPA